MNVKIENNISLDIDARLPTYFISVTLGFKS